MSSHRRNKLIFLKVIKGMFKSNFAKVKLLIWSFVNHGRGSESPSFDSLNYRFQPQKNLTDRWKIKDRQSQRRTERKGLTDRLRLTDRQRWRRTERQSQRLTDRQTGTDRQTKSETDHKLSCMIGKTAIS